MNRSVIHRVDGVGRQIVRYEDENFNSETFEQAIHGMQKMLLGWTRLEQRKVTEEDHEVEYKHSGEGDNKRVHIPEESMMNDVLTCIPRGWDITAVADEIRTGSYGIRVSADCGGGIIVRATIYVSDEMCTQIDIGHTNLADPEEFKEVDNITPHETARETAHITRWLERSVTNAYARELPSAATAYDYTATRSDIPPSGKRPSTSRQRRMSVSQKEWATIRDKTQQTVSDNVRTGIEAIRELPELGTFNENLPALTEISSEEDYQERDIILV